MQLAEAYRLEFGQRHTPARDLKHGVMDAGAAVLNAGKVKYLDFSEDARCCKELVVTIKCRRTHHVSHGQ